MRIYRPQELDLKDLDREDLLIQVGTEHAHAIALGVVVVALIVTIFLIFGTMTAGIGEVVKEMCPQQQAK